MEFKKLSNQVKRVKTGLWMNFNGTPWGVQQTGPVTIPPKCSSCPSW